MSPTYVTHRKQEDREKSIARFQSSLQPKLQFGHHTKLILLKFPTTVHSQDPNNDVTISNNGYSWNGVQQILRDWRMPKNTINTPGVTNKARSHEKSDDGTKIPILQVLPLRLFPVVLARIYSCLDGWSSHSQIYVPYCRNKERNIASFKSPQWLISHEFSFWADTSKLRISEFSDTQRALYNPHTANKPWI